MVPFASLESCLPWVETGWTPSFRCWEGGLAGGAFLRLAFDDFGIGGFQCTVVAGVRI